jgi:beta-barrel assembly-enhancing protease
MRYENPELPEDVNDSERQPLISFFKLAGTLLVLVAALGGILLLAAGRLAPLLPFHHERAVADAAFRDWPSDKVIEPYLKHLGERLARAQGLPPDLRIEVHYDDDPAVNAFATLGGHIVVYQGLLEVLPDENALAMVLAHEIAHVRHRHPIASLGRSAALSLALMLLGADTGAQSVATAMSQGGMLTMLSFSRGEEEEADATALETLARAYGHVASAERFFRHVLAEEGSKDPPRFLSSHPLTSRRIDAIDALAARRGWKTEGEITPIPAEVRAQIKRRSP